ncbi:MAG: hypothetical protein WBM98_04435 [Maribacter sp.]|uniref:hypothetical protein n=1 Tax=Maribacter sp. TaxID=1897614 RepID=UPI003C71324D
MKNSKLLLLVLVIMGCKMEKKPEQPLVATEPTILENIANAHGIQQWKNIRELQFTFNVDRDTSHFERTWIWKPKTNDIMAISKSDTLSYTWSKMDSVAYKTNGGFINDKYWLLAPFNLIWDKDNFTQTFKEQEIAPISKKAMDKLTIVYSSDGGYTPGDAYDFYFGDDYILKEWAYRKGNQPEASLVTTWEDYVEIDGLKIAKMHKNNEGFQLYFTNIEVKSN